ncbi:MAG: PQQ-binding-like beta-propeller repeat protein [Cytophagaceae bacterium]|nr:PQQ-binding-like beta-propeller repeat protein [Gemmatimonadaceae bacterium]
MSETSPPTRVSFLGASTQVPFPIHHSLFTTFTVLLLATAANAQDAGKQPDGEWRVHHRDYAGTHYSPLSQIDKSTVSKLGVAWRWSPDSAERPPDVRNISTPLMVKGTLYFTSGINRSVLAVDAGTGAVKWTWVWDDGARTRVAPRRGSGRGISYWVQGTDERIFVVTPGFRLVALDARTGKPVPAFGTDGVVDLKTHLGVPLNVDSAAIGSSSPPLVWGNTVVMGPALEVGLQPRSRTNVPGRILAVDARTGAFKWRFNTIPVKGEQGNETWEDRSWTYTGNAGAWAPLSLDARRGWVYLPVEAATGDYYGGHRHGNNLYSTSIVALDIRTGKRVWHYQVIHHDIWDFDNPAAPILADVTIAGRRREVLVQLTKQSFAYVLDRGTGRPIWPIVERAVPPSDVPGERASPTQPIPTRPAPYDRQGFSTDDLIDFTPALKARALQVITPYRLGPLFTPASLADAPDGTRGTLSMPGSVGGANWEAGALDPETGMLYVGSFTNPAVLAMTNDPKRSDMNYILAGGGGAPQVDGLPLVKPPWSRITAIDLRTGEHAWMQAAAETPDAVKNHPLLAGVTLPRTGGFTRPVILVTKTLLFTGEGSGGAPILRALDKRTGEVVWSMPMRGAVTAQPMTYLHNGKQYLAVWTGTARGRPPTELTVLSIP